jgi:hypothetical protein
MAPEGYPGQLVSTSELGADFMARQRVTAIYGEREDSFEAVLQLRDGVLTMLALSPFGTKAFVLTQKGTAVELQSFMDRELPFPPRYILLDIHRALFMNAPEQARPDGEHTREREGERIIEVWEDGRLRSRRFLRLDGAPPGVIEIRYPGGREPGTVPDMLEFDNGWFGYRLRIQTLDARALP